MADTRTWLTTPVGHSPADDELSEEYWVRGPSIPAEPRPPWRFRGAAILLAVIVAVVGLTFVLAPVFLDVQDPTFGGEPEPAERLDDSGFDPTFERPTAG